MLRPRARGEYVSAARAPTHGADPVDVYEAFYRVCHDFGVEPLARRMGMPVGTLYNKANPHDQSHHKPTLRDVVLVSTLTEDNRVLHALAHTLGEVCFRVPNLRCVSDMELLDLLTKVGAEGGEFHAALHVALEGTVTRREFDRVRLEALQWIGAIVECLGRVEGLVHE